MHNIKAEIELLKERFEEQQKIIELKQGNKSIRVTDLPNFSQAAIYKDSYGKTLLNGSNAMIAMFMTVFGQEVFTKFNLAFESHFEGKEDWEIKSNFKTNSVRIWQKINEYQKDTNFKKF